MIEEQKWSEEQKQTFRVEMLDLLEQSNMFSEVGKLNIYYGEIQTGIEYLIKSNDWQSLVELEHSKHSLPSNF